MATIIVEDGSQVAGANSYMTEAELVTYAADRGVTLTGDTSVLLIQAMDYIEGLNFKGYKTIVDQNLEWPRSYVVIDGWNEVDSDEIPQALKNGLAATAIAIDQGNSPLQVYQRSTVREKVDVLEVEYQAGSSSQNIDPNISNALKDLLRSGGSSGFPVHRG